jgi:putative ABC transport system permease protein
MLKNYFKIAYRNLLRQKGYSFINIFGLATGMACSILILLWVQDELSYDRFHANAENVYRITVEVNDLKAAISPAPLGRALEAGMPEVKKTTRVKEAESLFEAGGKKFQEKQVFYADSTFFDLFSFPFLQGDPSTALTNSNGLLLTESTARKYFGDENPVGKTIRKSNKFAFTVVGVLQDLPANSHLQFDFLLPMSHLALTDANLRENHWDNFDYFTYVQLQDGVDSSPAALAALNEKIEEVYLKNSSDKMKSIFRLQPLLDIHLKSKFLADVEGHGNIQYVRIFAVVAVFILLVACINFMNLATARSARRAKEVGLRKVIGAGRAQLMGQFFGESLLITLLALVLGLLLVELTLPFYNDLTGKRLAIRLLDGKMLLGLLAITLFVGLFSGSYPALLLSSFQPVKVLKGGVKFTGGNVLFRNGLVVTQFVVAVVLLIGTAVVYRQLHFIQNRNLGYDKENLLYVPLRGDLYSHYQALKDELSSTPLTADFTFVSELPINLINSSTSADWEGKDPNMQVTFSTMEIDEKFMDVLGVKLLTGRSFSAAHKSDRANFILNEKAVAIMGLDPASAIGKTLTFWDSPGTIIGVVQDFNFQPVQHPVEPMVLRLNTIGLGYAIIRTKPGQVQETVASLERLWQKFNPVYPFAFDFIDQDLARLYKAERRMGLIFNIFAGLAIFISCLGLYGIAAFTAEQRTKEIGIRKVLGASVGSIVGMLSKGFVRLVLVAILIATPLAWYGMSQWLEDYAYHIDLEWWVFATAGMVAILIALLTVSFQSVKAALMNPVKSLRGE